MSCFSSKLTRCGGDGGMEEGDARVDEEGITWDEFPDDGVCRLEEDEADEDRKQLGTLVEEDFEEDRDTPHNKSSSEKRRCFALFITSAAAAATPSHV